MRLFRAISIEEHQDLVEFGFRAGPNSLAGKWFADFYNHAYLWGKAFGYQERFSIVEIDFPDQRVNQLFQIELLDGIGPAKYLTIDDLKHATLITIQTVI